MLLLTKLQMPRVRPQLVPRLRLQERLEKGLQRKLTLISAPAGYGKTTLVVQWLRQRPAHVAWLSLDVEDNDLARFVTYLVAALQQAEPTLSDSACTALSTLQPLTPQAIMTHLINDLVYLDPTLVLTLDDYHLISSPAIHEALAFFVDQMPSGVHLVVTTRTELPWSLAQLRMQDQITALHTADLRFTGSEAATFLAEAMDLDLSLPAVHELEKRTEGWIAGLQMAALSLREHADIDEFLSSFGASQRYILDFFSEQVLHRLPEEIQRYLLRTSILERLSADLCTTVLHGETGITPASTRAGQQMLDELERRNLFLVPLDGERRWYRYHQLFVDLLYQRLQQSVPATEIATLHDRASRWYEAQGLLGDAVHHAIAADKVERAADLIAHICDAFFHGEAARLRRWLQALPANLVRARPKLALYNVLVSLYERENDENTAQLDEVEALLAQDTAADCELKGILAAARSLLAFANADVDDAIAQACRAQDLLPETSTIWRTEVALLLGSAYWVIGDMQAAENTYRQLHMISRQAGDHFTALYVTWRLGALHHGNGELRQAAAYYEKVMAKAIQPGLGLIGAQAALSLGLIRREWNHLAEAEAIFRRGLELTQAASQYAGWRRTLRVRLYTALAHVAHHRGDAAVALELLDTAEEIARSQEPADLDDLLALLDIYRTFFSIAQGDVEAVRTWLVTHAPDERAIGISMVMEEHHKTLCQAWVRGLLIGDEASVKRALTLARRLEPIFAGGGHERDAIYMRLGMACAHQLLGDDTQGLALLEPILQQAEPEGLVRTFVDWGEPMSALLRQAAARNRMPNYVARLLAACTVDPWHGQDRGTSVLVEPLSAREAEILRAIAAGHTNQEIADDLVISVATVKRHITNIYGKLGVRNRAEAVTSVHAMSLLT